MGNYRRRLTKIDDMIFEYELVFNPYHDSCICDLCCFYDGIECIAPLVDCGDGNYFCANPHKI